MRDLDFLLATTSVVRQTVTGLGSCGVRHFDLFGALLFLLSFRCQGPSVQVLLGLRIYDTRREGL